MASKNREKVRPPRDLLVSWLARLYKHRLTTTTGGNLSVLDDEGIFYITPSGGDKAIVPPSNVAILRPGRDDFEGPCPPSVEWPLHTAVYRVRPECRAVLHAHSTTLVAFSLAQQQTPEDKGSPCCSCCNLTNKFLPSSDSSSVAISGVPETRCLLSAWQSCGQVVLAPYEIPGSQELADGCAAAFSTGVDCVILQNHGVVTAGTTMQEAYDRFVSLEYLAQSIVNALPLGTPKLLPKSILEALRTSQSDEENNDKLSKRPRLLRGAYQYEEIRKTINKCLPAPCCGCTRTISGDEKVSREILCKYVARAYNQNIITSSSGSFSVRVNMKPKGGITDHHDAGMSFLVTPTNVDRGSLESIDLCFMSTEDCCRHASSCHFSGNENGKVLVGKPHVSCLRWHPLSHCQYGMAPSRASAMHAAIYAAHPELCCIMIVQPPNATAYCITGRHFDAAGIPEAYLVLRDVQVLSIENALKDDFSELLKALNPDKGRHTILISGYGMLTVASDPLKAFVQMEVCESMCDVMLTALRRGPVKLLSQDEISSIRDTFKIKS